MKLRLKESLLIVVFLMIHTCVLKSQEYSREIGIQTDNDAYLWYGQDRYYTNGLFIFYRQAAEQSKFLGKEFNKIIYEVGIGQQMYTPLSAFVPEPYLQDRPFAGYLFANGQVNLFFRNEQVLKAGLSLGTIGPHAMGQETQNLLHQTVGLYETSGWEYQIDNAVAIDVKLNYTALFFRKQNVFDISLESQLNLGTTFTGMGLGLLFRTGNINPFSQSAYHNARIGRNQTMRKALKKELYVYAKPQLNYVAYDATIQGGLFSSGSPVTFDVRPLVFEQKIGLNYSNDRFTLDYALMFKSREIYSPARHHQYGSISAYYRF
ncbi:lipid A deacylase LpxR family protein [Sphingobacterium deserti]|uniref:Lipid A deacylase LpxR family protein n=1 Tax=Sphingobacterium deserti TaxID=1229276 RepID=A0A0B8TBD5_9SPHI|nr:lipid A deacylase LpxR family protein [Sphingobacterium deserti]KGE16194.1 hypothetical protein DI53_0027 [Sphingobacterium deserti]